jgi:hypothetical protein
VLPAAQPLVEPTSVAIIEFLYREKQIKREIALRKVFEYYVFEAIPNTPE